MIVWLIKTRNCTGTMSRGTDPKNKFLWNFISLKWNFQRGCLTKALTFLDHTASHRAHWGAAQKILLQFALGMSNQMNHAPKVSLR